MSKISGFIRKDVLANINGLIQQVMGDPPSPAATRIMEALNKRPELAAEIRELLNREFKVQEKADALALAELVAAKHAQGAL